MASRLTLAVLVAFAISLLMVGTGGAAKCTPHCSPDNSNQGAELKGLDRAQSSAGDHGLKGRCNAATQQGVTLDACNPTPPQAPPPPSGDPLPPTTPPPGGDPLPPPGV